MADFEWYYAENGKAVGPMSRTDLVAKLDRLQRGETLVFGPGLTAWTAAKHVPGLRGIGEEPADFAPPPVAGRRSDEIDYRIYGEEMQYVETELDPGEMMIAEAGNMMFMSSGVDMQTTFGDPSAQGGFFSKLMSAGKRVLTGESLFMTTFSSRGPGKQRVAFAAPYPGKIVPMDLAQLGGEMLCQKDSFLCAARGVSVGIAFTKRFGAGLFGGEGFILQRLTGDGVAFVHAGGTLCHKRLGPGETLRVDTGCLVAFQPSVEYEIKFVGGFKNTLFGGEGLFFAMLTGPGEVWLQSLPFSRLAGRIVAASAGGKGEGSILGSLGGLLDGDNS
ncbi:MAG: hypothetical protein AMXMBFR47_28080 [Planctomycetota bacterium]